MRKKTMRTKQQEKKKETPEQNKFGIGQKAESRTKTFKELEHNNGVLSYAYSLTNRCEKISQVGSDEYIIYLIYIIGENL